jgi:hypothetical protein
MKEYGFEFLLLCATAYAAILLGIVLVGKERSHEEGVRGWVLASVMLATSFSSAGFMVIMNVPIFSAMGGGLLIGVLVLMVHCVADRYL